jgi:hypothetical protein
MTATRILMVPMDRFDNEDYIERRLHSVPEKSKGSLRTALGYLYRKDGPVNLPRSRLKTAEEWLEPTEKILIRWLYTRTNGSLRSKYGTAALLQARCQCYRCEHCGHADVRVLNLDHVNGRNDKSQFACLCSNCHCLKSRDKDWLGIPQAKEQWNECPVESVT